jgi:hypothetical protein
VIVRGPRPAANVWEDYALIARWPAWAPHMTSVDAAAGRIAEGVTGHVHGGPIRLPFTITHVDEAAMAWEWQVLGITLRHTVQGTPTGCLTTFDGPLPYLPVAWIALWVLTHRQQPRDRLDG